MKTLTTSTVRSIGAVPAVACLLLAAVVTTSAWATDDELPSGAQVLDTFVEATGGKAAHDKIRSRVSRGTMTVVGAGLEGDVTSFWSGGQTYFSWESAMGKIENGVCDGVAWEVSPMTGARIKEGAEHLTALRMATLDHIQNWRDYYGEAKCVGIEMVDGRSCYKVILSAEGEPDFTNYYDRETGLHVKLESEVTTAQGDGSIVFLIDDYREVDGVLIPHETTLTLNKVQTMLFKTVSNEHNVEISDETFALPEIVRSKLEPRRAEHTN